MSTNEFTDAYKDMLDNYTVDSVLDSTSTNPIQNGTVTDALALKQPKTLSAPIVVGGVSSTTVEGALGNLNALVDTKLPMVTSLPASPSNGEAVLYIGTASGGLKTGGIYQYQVSEWVLISYAESFTFNSDDFDVDTTTSTVSLSAERRVYNGTKAVWDTLSVAEKTQYGATAFTDDGDTGADVYSTTESLTNKKWIAGKPIYRKVVDIGTLPDATIKSVAHGISSLGTVVNFHGMITNNIGRLPLPFVSTGIEHCIMCVVTDTTIDITTGVDRTAFAGWMVIEYTKSTD